MFRMDSFVFGEWERPRGGVSIIAAREVGAYSKIPLPMQRKSIILGFGQVSPGGVFSVALHNCHRWDVSVTAKRFRKDFRKKVERFSEEHMGFCAIVWRATPLLSEVELSAHQELQPTTETAARPEGIHWQDGLYLVPTPDVDGRRRWQTIIQLLLQKLREDDASALPGGRGWLPEANGLFRAGPTRFDTGPAKAKGDSHDGHAALSG